MPIQAFISSTSQDLGDYRLAAIEICNTLKIVPIAMEFFHAMGLGATAGSKKKLEEADLYIGLFAHRYGYVEQGHDRSVTEIEFDYAGELGLQRLCFIIDPSYPWPPDAIDYKQLDSLNQFKAKVNTSLIRAQFTTVEDFKLKLTGALVEWQQMAAPPLQPPDDEQQGITQLVAVSPPAPSLVVGREEDVARLKVRLGLRSGTSKRPLTMVRGWPGVGKTTLISTLAHDPEVMEAFPDGVLWASSGEHPDPIKELKAWGQALGAHLGSVRSLNEVLTQLRALLYHKKALLIVDDIWESDAALPFRVGGADCATLMTTRFGDVARAIAVRPDDVYVLQRLSDEGGIELLAQLAPAVAESYAVECRQLVGDLEGLPLALRVAGRLLEGEVSSGFDVRETFTALGSKAALLQETAPEDRFDPHTGTTPTIQLLLQKSTDRLDAKTRERFALLGAFAPKPATFDLGAIKAVCAVEDPKPLVLKLVDRGLLEPIPAQGRFWMHAILVMHATNLLESFEDE